MSLSWKENALQTAKITVNSDHPWWFGLQEQSDMQGFYSLSAHATTDTKLLDKRPMTLGISTPNQVKLYIKIDAKFELISEDKQQKDNRTVSCETSIKIVKKSQFRNPYQDLESSPLKHTVYFALPENCTPLTMFVCDAQLSLNECGILLNKM